LRAESKADLGLDSTGDTGISQNVFAKLCKQGAMDALHHSDGNL